MANKLKFYSVYLYLNGEYRSVPVAAETVALYGDKLVFQVGLVHVAAFKEWAYWIEVQAPVAPKQEDTVGNDPYNHVGTSL